MRTARGAFAMSKIMILGRDLNTKLQAHLRNEVNRQNCSNGEQGAGHIVVRSASHAKLSFERLIFEHSQGRLRTKRL
jgi:hypothetical protein